MNNNQTIYSDQTRRRKRRKRKNRRACVWIFAILLTLLVISAIPKNSPATSDKASQKEIYDYLTLQLGYNSAAACGIMANLKSESNFNSYNLQDVCEKRLGYTDLTYTTAVDNGDYSAEEFATDGAGYGLCQWTYETRKEGLYKMAQEWGVSISDYEVQLNYMDSELTETQREHMMSLPDTQEGAYDAGYYFCEVFEKPKSEAEPKQRGKTAEKYYNKYND